jgi:hypothetical protein
MPKTPASPEETESNEQSESFQQGQNLDDLVAAELLETPPSSQLWGEEPLLGAQPLISVTQSMDTWHEEEMPSDPELDVWHEEEMPEDTAELQRAFNTYASAVDRDNQRHGQVGMSVDPERDTSYSGGTMGV